MILNISESLASIERSELALSCEVSYVRNQTAEESLHRDQHAVIVTYWVLMVFGAVGNLGVLIGLERMTRPKTRVDMLMTHLAVADVSVTCGVIPLEIGWKYTNEWLAGNILCKLLLVMRAFGLYLSSNILVCISLDRFFAVLYPQTSRVARKRTYQMLYCAWAVALVCSLPQSVVFRVLEHPQVPGFMQCVSFGAFSSAAQEVAYNVGCLNAMYFVPLIIISTCYVCIFCKIRRCSKDLDGSCIHGDICRTRNGTNSVRLRRSDHQLLERACRRTLKMTVIIVTVFFLCWLPYAVMALWYMIDWCSASLVSPQLQDLLFAMAVSNSCMNPLVYGSYAFRTNASFQRFLKKACFWSTDPVVTTGNTGFTTNKNGIRSVGNPGMISKTNARSQRRVRFAETSLVEEPHPQRGYA